MAGVLYTERVFFDLRWMEEERGRGKREGGTDSIRQSGGMGGEGQSSGVYACIRTKVACVHTYEGKIMSQQHVTLNVGAVRVCVYISTHTNTHARTPVHVQYARTLNSSRGKR